VSLIGFCGSRSLLPSPTPLVAGVVSSVLSSRRSVAVGCCVGADACVLRAVLAAGAAPCFRVFAAFGPVSPPYGTAARVEAPGASRSLSWPSGVGAALRAGASVRWWSGGGPAVPLTGRLASRSAALVSAVASSGSGAGLVGFVSSPCPPALIPSPLPARCFSGRGPGSGSWGSLALAAGLRLPVVVFRALGARNGQHEPTFRDIHRPFAERSRLRGMVHE
jgi:hypothetical protein